jgi:hypothetical protein
MASYFTNIASKYAADQAVNRYIGIKPFQTINKMKRPISRLTNSISDSVADFKDEIGNAVDKQIMNENNPLRFARNVQRKSGKLSRSIRSNIRNIKDRARNFDFKNKFSKDKNTLKKWEDVDFKKDYKGFTESDEWNEIEMLDPKNEWTSIENDLARSDAQAELKAFESANSIPENTIDEFNETALERKQMSAIEEAGELPEDKVISDLPYTSTESVSADLLPEEIGAAGEVVGGDIAAGVGGDIAADAALGSVFATAMLPEILAGGLAVAAVGGLAYGIYEAIDQSDRQDDNRSLTNNSFERTVLNNGVVESSYKMDDEYENINGKTNRKRSLTEVYGDTNATLGNVNPNQYSTNPMNTSNNQRWSSETVTTTRTDQKNNTGFSTSTSSLFGGEHSISDFDKTETITDQTVTTRTAAAPTEGGAGGNTILNDVATIQSSVEIAPDRLDIFSNFSVNNHLAFTGNQTNSRVGITSNFKRQKF